MADNQWTPPPWDTLDAAIVTEVAGWHGLLRKSGHTWRCSWRHDSSDDIFAAIFEVSLPEQEARRQSLLFLLRKMQHRLTEANDVILALGPLLMQTQSGNEQ